MKQALIPLVFFAQFKRPLTLKQIRRYAWGKEFEMDELKRILKKAHIKQVGAYYCLDENHLMESAERYMKSDRYWKKVKKYLWVFANVPFVKMVLVSNTLSYDYVSKNSDIDLFVVTSKNRVWIVRAFLLTLLSVVGIRATGKQKRMRFSPEMLVDETALDLSLNALAEDYLTHYFIADMVPVWGVDYFNKFWSANRWLQKKLPVAYRSPNLREDFNAKSKSSWFAWLSEKILTGSFGDRVEMWAKRRQGRSIDKAVLKMGITPDVLQEKHVIETHYYGQRMEMREKVDDILARDEKETTTV